MGVNRQSSWRGNEFDLAAGHIILHSPAESVVNFGVDHVKVNH